MQNKTGKKIYIKTKHLNSLMKQKKRPKVMLIFNWLERNHFVTNYPQIKYEGFIFMWFYLIKGKVSKFEFFFLMTLMNMVGF